MVPRRRFTHRRAARLAVFLCAAASLLAAIVYFAVERRSVERAIADLRRTHDALRPMFLRVQAGQEQAAVDQQVVLSLLGICRNAQDIPDLQSDRIVARQEGSDSLCMYVPDGAHRLEIISRWKPASTGPMPSNPVAAAPPSGEPAGTSAAPTSAGPAGATGQQVWSIPLAPASGYWLQLISDHRGKTLRWELSGNHPDFETRRETIPLDGFVQRGASWSVDRLIRFPNQVSFRSVKDLQAAADAPPGVVLMQATLHGPRLGRPHEVTFTVRLISDAPACVSASDAHRIIVLGRADLLQPYQGGGKYHLRSASAASETSG